MHRRSPERQVQSDKPPDDRPAVNRSSSRMFRHSASFARSIPARASKFPSSWNSARFSPVPEPLFTQTLTILHNSWRRRTSARDRIRSSNPTPSRPEWPTNLFGAASFLLSLCGKMRSWQNAFFGWSNGSVPRPLSEFANCAASNSKLP
jgi:hypothetical protein